MQLKIIRKLLKNKGVSYIVSNKEKLSSYTWKNIQKDVNNKSNTSLKFKGLLKENPSNSNVKSLLKYKMDVITLVHSV